MARLSEITSITNISSIIFSYSWDNLTYKKAIYNKVPLVTTFWKMNITNVDELNMIHDYYTKMNKMNP